MKVIKLFSVITTTLVFLSFILFDHGTTISPQSRVHRVYESNPENPDFQLAVNAVNMDSKNAYYTWNQVSRNILEAVTSGLPEGFDYSPWIPDGQLASAGRLDPAIFGELTYSGLDQVSPDWPTTEVNAGSSAFIDFFATASHEPSVWDVWMTTPDWTPNVELNWAQMEFLGRPSPQLSGSHYTFNLDIPEDRSGHHVLWIAWQRNDPLGEVFISTSDLSIINSSNPGHCDDHITINNIGQPAYHAATSITCSATISDEQQVSLKAGSAIDLTNFFKIEQGAGIELSIEECQN